MNGSSWLGGHARHTALPPHLAVGSGAPSSPASWLCPSLGHSRSSSSSSTSSSLLLTPPHGATLASFVGFGQRPPLSPQSPPRYLPTLSGSERDGEPATKAERKRVLLRDSQGWYFSVPESALEASPEVAPRALPPARHTRSPIRAPPSPRILPSALPPPSPVLPQMTVSPPPGTDALGLSLNAVGTDNTRPWPSSSRASGPFASGSSSRSPWSPPQEVSHSPLWGPTGLPLPPSASPRSPGVAVGLRLVESWSPSPSPARLGRWSIPAPLQDGLGLSPQRLPSLPPAPALDLPSLPLAVPSAFDWWNDSPAPKAPALPVVPQRVSCYDENDEIVTRHSVTVNAAARIRSPFADLLPTHRLGGGSQGRVVRVEECRTGRAFALKVVHKGLAAKRKFSRRNFLTERNIMLAVNESEDAGRFLMRVLMCWEDVEKDQVYFVMPLYHADLATVLLKKEEIPMASRYLMCKEMICALVALYHLGVVHSDIKPANILIGHDGHAVLTDFGNAKHVPVYDYATWRGYTRDGSYPYMAPEMVSADVKRIGYGTGIDVWSLGLTLMEIIGMCDGPFVHQRTLEGVQDEHANSGRLPIHPDKFLCTEERFWEILPAMLQVDPKKRITVQQLEDKYVRSEEWTAVRNGSATHDWRPTVNVPAADVEDASHFLDLSPYSNSGRRYGIDPLEFQYCAPGVF